MKIEFSDVLGLSYLEDDDDSVAGYIYLPGHPRELTVGVVKETKRLDKIIPGYKGPDIMLDFNSEGVLIGIELLLESAQQA